MAWWLWMLVGAGLPVLAYGGLALLERLTPPRVHGDLVARQQFEAERAMQEQLQQTLGELFAAARRSQR